MEAQQGTVGQPPLTIRNFGSVPVLKSVRVDTVEIQVRSILKENVRWRLQISFSGCNPVEFLLSYISMGGVEFIFYKTL